MLLFAHRGYHARNPENTLAAFAAAVQAGVDGIETDVRLSADAQPVVIHDRITPRGRPVAELARREIERDVGHAVPTLDEILEAFPGVIWNIEIKNPEAWPAAARILANYRASRRLIVSSFRHEVVRQCAQDLAIDCALLLAHRPLDVDTLMESCASLPSIKAIVWDYNVMDESVVSTVHARNWKNFVYGPVTPAEHARCRELGLAGVITDHPLTARESLQ